MVASNATVSTIQEAQEARQKAETLSQEIGLLDLSYRISQEYNSFFKQLDEWEEYVSKDVPLTTRIVSLHLEDHFVRMLHQRYEKRAPHPRSTEETIEEYQEYLAEAKKIFTEYEQ
ncbi:MAG: hypothetical protein ACFFFH_17605 [Candidatus Thorarchaeota archaeon]